MKKHTENPNVEVLNDFYYNLQRAVADTGLTPYALAMKIGFDKNYISRLMHGDRDPNFSTIVRFINGTHFSLDELLGKRKRSISSSKVEEATTSASQALLIDKIKNTHEDDIEILDAIADILNKKRAHAVAKLVHAVKEKKDPPNKNKGLLSKAGKIAEVKISKVISSKRPANPDDDEDEDFLDDDFDFDEKSFEEDSDFDEDPDDDDYDDDDDDDDDDDEEDIYDNFL